MFFSKREMGFFSPDLGPIPDDAVELTAVEYEALLRGQAEGLQIASDDSGRPVLRAFVPNADQQISIYTDAIQRHLDTFAASRGYNSLLSACSYATSTVPRFAAEGQYCVTLRDQTWTQCYQILGEFEKGLRPAPTLDELLAELPQPEWPQ